jgi:hypothetical protein
MNIHPLPRAAWIALKLALVVAAAWLATDPGRAAIIYQRF